MSTLRAMEFMISWLGAFMMTSRVKFVGMVRHSPSTRQNSSSFSAMAAALCSLKGPRHGGANLMVMQMMQNIRENLHDTEDDEELEAYLKKLLHGEAFDRKGLIYGMGHAVYTISDPREVVLKQRARHLAYEKGFEEEYNMLCSIERLAPGILPPPWSACTSRHISSSFASSWVNF